MKKGIKMCLLVLPLVIITILISIFLVNKFKVFQANKKAEEQITVGDNIEIQDIEELSQKEIKVDDSIGKLTIPDILLDNAPIKEGTELSILSTAIGHFTSTGIYSGNVGLASHNGGSNGDYFRNLNKIKKGSEIYYQTIYGTRRYVVQTITIIEETDFSYLEATEDNRITLVTCVHNQPTKRLCIQAVESEKNLKNI